MFVAVAPVGSLLHVAVRRRDLEVPRLLDVGDAFDPAERFDPLGVDGPGQDPEILQPLLDLHPDIFDALDDLGETVQVLVVDGDQ
jgi:hypothetical protein